MGFEIDHDQRIENCENFMAQDIEARFAQVISALETAADWPFVRPESLDSEAIRRAYNAKRPADEQLDATWFANQFANMDLINILDILTPEARIEIFPECLEGEKDEGRVYRDLWLEFFAHAKVPLSADDITLSVIEDDPDYADQNGLAFSFDGNAYEFYYDRGSSYLDTSVFNDFNDFALAAGLETGIVHDEFNDHAAGGYVLPMSAVRLLDPFRPPY